MGYKTFGRHPRCVPLRAIGAAMLTTSALFAAAPAQAATYPQAGGSTFEADAQGWSSLRAECSAASGTAVCTQTNAHDSQDGNPPGSIVARTSVIVNAGQLFQGDSTWRSPTFVAQASAGTGVLQYDRRLQVEGLLALSPQTAIEVLVVDEATGAAASLGTETLTTADSVFTARRITVAPGTLVAGRPYHIELRSTTTTTTARLGVLGTAEIDYDNVRLDLPDAAGAGGSTGVSFPGSSLSASAVDRLIRQLSLFAEGGSGPGGSLVPLARCTIVGTPGKDRIRGSSGNDVICGLGGNDTITGAGGRDVIDGANGNDRLSGAAGADLLLGLRGRDRLGGGSGKDGIGSGAGSDRARGGSGNDKVVGVCGADRLHSGRGKDRLLGGAGRDRLEARDRNRDLVDGGKGRDRATVDRPGRSGRRVKGLRSFDRVRRVERRR